MRTWGWPLLALMFSFSLAAQESTTPTTALHLDGLQIPAELTKTVKAEKASPGDEVHLRMVEPILVGQGLVIPENARLHGVILRASGAENGSRSRISVLVDRAEWKGHVLPLRAFIRGFGVHSRTERGRVDCTSRSQSTDLSSHKSFKNALSQTNSSDTEFDTCMSGTSEEEAAVERSRLHLISEIQMFHNPREGYTVLVSKKNIHLPGGLLLVLQNTEEVPLTAKN